eukprot:jgi/Picre1/33182/NNA_008507.t1
MKPLQTVNDKDHALLGTGTPAFTGNALIKMAIASSMTTQMQVPAQMGLTTFSASGIPVINGAIHSAPQANGSPPCMDDALIKMAIASSMTTQMQAPVQMGMTTFSASGIPVISGAIHSAPQANGSPPCMDNALIKMAIASSMTAQMPAPVQMGMTTFSASGIPVISGAIHCRVFSH